MVVEDLQDLGIGVGGRLGDPVQRCRADKDFHRAVHEELNCPLPAGGRRCLVPPSCLFRGKVLGAHHGRVYSGRQDGRLGVEHEVHSLRGDAGPSGDGFHCRPVVAVRSELVCSCLHDRPARRRGTLPSRKSLDVAHLRDYA